MTRIEKDIVEFLREKGLLSKECTLMTVKGDFGATTINQLMIEFVEKERKHKIIDEYSKKTDWRLPSVEKESTPIEYNKLPEHLIYHFNESWMCCCSYYQPNTQQRNMRNILIKQDQFPTIQECKEQIENDLGFNVEDVVLMNWKEVSNDYKL